MFVPLDGKCWAMVPNRFCFCVPGDQGPDFPEVPRLCPRAVRLAPLLLVPHQRGYPVSEGLPPPSPRDRALHPQEANQAGPKAKSSGSLWTRWRGQVWWEERVQEGTRSRRQGWRRRSWLIPSRIRKYEKDPCVSSVSQWSRSQSKCTELSKYVTTLLNYESTTVLGVMSDKNS